MKEIYPITYFDNVINKETNKNLTQALASVNHYNFGEVESKIDARFMLPKACRVKGMYITYIIEDTIYTDILISNSDEVTDDNIIDDSHWHNVLTL